MVSTDNNAANEVENEITDQLKSRNIDSNSIKIISAKISQNLSKSLADEFLKPSGVDSEKKSIATHKDKIAKHVVELIESKRSTFSKVFGTKISVSEKQIEEISKEVTNGFKEKAITQTASGFPQDYATNSMDRQLIEKLALNADALYKTFKSDSQHKSKMELEFPGKDIENLEILINKFSSRDTLDNHRDPKNIEAFKDFKREVAKLININPTAYQEICDLMRDKAIRDEQVKNVTHNNLSPESLYSARKVGAGALDWDIELKQAKSYIKPEAKKPEAKKSLSVAQKIAVKVKKVFKGKGGNGYGM